MSERIDLAGRAWDTWNHAISRGHPEAMDNPVHESMLTMLNALVEQQRIGNLIALGAIEGQAGFDPLGPVNAIGGLKPDIAAALGLTAGQEGDDDEQNG